MTLVSLEKIERSFGDLQILAGASMRVDEGARIGVIGDNGTGKTTLIRILAGVDDPDRGSRNVRRGLRLAYGEQIPEIGDGTTVFDFVARGNGEAEQLERRITALEQQLADRPNDQRLLDDYGHLQAAFEAGGGYQRNHLCEKVLSGIGFRRSEWDKDATLLSGGETTRLMLAALMAVPAELLILDEPTNHLDLEGIEFVEDYVQRYPGAVVVISHDRQFLDAVATSIVEVAGGTTSRFKGNYSQYAKQRDQQLLTEARAFKSQHDFIQKEMEYIRRNMGSRMTAQAKGRLKRLQRLQVIQAPKRGAPELRLKFGADVRGQSGQAMIEAEGLDVALPNGRVLVKCASFRLYHGETLGLMGRNGTGKTTLMKTLASGARPVGVSFAHRLRIGYFRQEVTDLPRGVTVLDALRQLDATVPEKELRDHLALFLFSGDRVDDLVDTLSGGEKQRLGLAILTRSPYDLLCLDEPTNHLDITGREGLEKALAAFPGTVLLISHDRRLLDAIADRILYLDGGRVRTFERGLSHLRETLAAERQARRETQRKDSTKAVDPAPASTGEPSKIRNPLMFQRLEEEIFALEEELGSVRAKMAEPESYLNHDRMKALQARENELEASLADAYERWENWQ